MMKVMKSFGLCNIVWSLTEQPWRWRTKTSNVFVQIKCDVLNKKRFFPPTGFGGFAYKRKIDFMILSEMGNGESVQLPRNSYRENHLFPNQLIFELNFMLPI